METLPICMGPDEFYKGPESGPKIGNQNIRLYCTKLFARVTVYQWRVDQSVSKYIL